MQNFIDIVARIAPKGIIGLVAATTVATSGMVGYQFIRAMPGTERVFAEERAIETEGRSSVQLAEDDGGNVVAVPAVVRGTADAIPLSFQTSTPALVIAANTRVAQNASVNTPVAPANISVNTPAAGTFTPATLALHNRTGDCYIAYRGTVYDVSVNPSWAGCRHHGTSGGADITALFPHSTSYLNSLPIVGILGVAVQETPGGTSTVSGVPAATDLRRSDDDGNGDERDEEDDAFYGEYEDD